jgi:hypothetical protein
VFFRALLQNNLVFRCTGLLKLIPDKEIKKKSWLDEPKSYNKWSYHVSPSVTIRISMFQQYSQNNMQDFQLSDSKFIVPFTKLKDGDWETVRETETLAVEFDVHWLWML